VLDPGLSVTVLGPPGVLRDVVAHVLAAAGGSTPPTDEAGSAHTRTLTVLVDPTFADWEAARAAGAPILLFTTRALDDEAVMEAVVRGADAVLHGDSDPDEMSRAATVVAEGGTALSPARVRALADLVRACERPGHSLVQRLTRREVEILTSIDRGESVKQTARAIGISTKTVENLQTRLFRKLGVRNRAQAIMRAHSAGLVSSPPGGSAAG
jgi:DNA-binding NarL/FixJ family response regulator